MISNTKYQSSTMPLFGIWFYFYCKILTNESMISIPRHLKCCNLCKCISRETMRKEIKLFPIWTLGSCVYRHKNKIYRVIVHNFEQSNLTNYKTGVSHFSSTNKMFIMRSITCLLSVLFFFLSLFKKTKQKYKSL